MSWPARAACWLALGLVAQAGTVPATGLEQQIRAILGRYKIREADCGVYVASVARRKAVAAINADEPLVIASNKKLLTTAAALDLLGPGYELVTRVCIDGPLENGVLKGNIVIVGGGDPNISARFYEGEALAVPKGWARTIHKAGIERIQGDVVADDRIFDRQLLHPDWPDNQLDRWYCAPVCGLAYNDGCVDVTVSPGPAAGSPASVSLDPATSYVKLENGCKTTSARNRHVVSFGRRPGSRTIRAWGECWVKAEGLTGSVAIDDPALMLATVLREQLDAAGVQMAGGAVLAARDGKAARLTEICRTTSDLATSVVIANKRSQNLYAEQMHKLLGALVERDGSFEGGNRALGRFLAGLGIRPGSYTSADGSGMSRNNRFSAQQVGSVLLYMADHPSTAAFVDSLSIGGVDGTLSRRLEGVRGRIRAKTGHLAGASALSGYVTSEEGEPQLAFSILMNSPRSTNAAQDDICQLLVRLAEAIE